MRQRRHRKEKRDTGEREVAGNSSTSRSVKAFQFGKVDDAKKKKPSG